MKGLWCHCSKMWQYEIFQGKSRGGGANIINNLWGAREILVSPDCFSSGQLFVNGWHFTVLLLWALMCSDSIQEEFPGVWADSWQTLAVACCATYSFSAIFSEVMPLKGGHSLTFVSDLRSCSTLNSTPSHYVLFWFTWLPSHHVHCLTEPCTIVYTHQCISVELHMVFISIKVYVHQTQLAWGAQWPLS
jgi:hypothetical protein